MSEHNKTSLELRGVPGGLGTGTNPTRRCMECLVLFDPDEATTCPHCAFKRRRAGLDTPTPDQTH